MLDGALNAIPDERIYDELNFDNYKEYLKQKYENGTQFYSNNSFSRLLLITKKGDTIFSVPTIFATSIEINREHIICVSNKKIFNDYQIVVYDFTGRMIFKKSISASGILLTPQNLEKTKSEFPRIFDLVDSVKAIYPLNNDYWIDMYSTEVTSLIERDSLKTFVKYGTICQNPISENISGSVTNSVTWFYLGKGGPKIRIKIKNGVITKFSFLDPKGRRSELLLL
jgi:hypothetical protein